ncbi:MAG: rRNA maturation RNase YbeY [Paludibacter sp.]|nr:rRNA maturation RNase YbeY [Paludibacter sp.]
MIQFLNENIKAPNLRKRDVTQWIKKTAEQYGKKTGEIAFIFCNDAKILEINQQYLQHDYYTDIITFDYSQNNIISGDIFISLDTVKTNAEKFGVDFHQELHRIIIHGILHLCGQDDKTPESRKAMTTKENEALNDLAMDGKRKAENE